MHEYGFDPKFILVALVNIYVYFKDYREFMEYVVKDERSYKSDNFEKVINLKENEKISIDYETYDQFIRFVSEIKEVALQLKAKEISYDDAPEEFMDPITNDLMSDPVMLPNSKIIVDRNTIGIIRLIKKRIYYLTQLIHSIELI